MRGASFRPNLRQKASLVKKVSLLSILFCAMSLPVFAQQAADDNAGLEILALEHEWVEGQSRNDNRALDLIFDNALVYVEYGRLVTKGEYLLRIRTGGPNLEQIVMEPMTVHTFGTTATVVGTYREKSVNDGKPSLKRWRFVDTWVKKKGRWMLVAAASSPLSK